MNTISPSQARQNFKSILQSVSDNKSPLIITRSEGNVVLFAEDEWNSIQETLHLLSSPKNAQHLQDALQSVAQEKNLTKFASLEDLDDAI